MTSNDPISDMLARINNAQTALHAELSLPVSKSKVAVATILKEQGFIADCSVDEKAINITLKYNGGRGLITGMKRVSKPGRRVYVGVEDIPRVRNGLGISIVSTSKGILEGGAATEQRVGGELLCEIW